MTPAAAVLLTVISIALFVLPRRWAAGALVATACYVPLGVGIELGPFAFYGQRLVLALAFVRALLRGEGLQGGLTGPDRWMLVWAAVAAASSAFQPDVQAALVNRLGLIYTLCGSYFALRIFLPTLDDVQPVMRITAWLLVPLAAAMLHERLTGENSFAVFAAIANNLSEVRDGTIRAQGSFAHSILAGSVGAACLPLAVALWRSARWTSAAGVVACLVMVYSSGSSGPLMSAAMALLALALWPARARMRLIRWLALGGYGLLAVAMNAPAYYVLTRIDLTGSSTSWHRAALIEAAIAHLPEWWLAGTAFTRHWMPYGVPWSAEHVDITNYYLRMGVDGGLPLMLAFIAVLARAFGLVGRGVHGAQPVPPAARFAVWALGASLLAHAAAFISVSYFDQSVVFLVLTLATISATASASATAPATATTPVREARRSVRMPRAGERRWAAPPPRRRITP